MNSNCRTSHFSLVATLFTMIVLASSNVNGEDGFVRGRVEAPVSIVVYADFECVYCSKSNAVLNDIARLYPDSVSIIFKHFPLRQDDAAMLSHEAASEAAHQGKFWEMHDWLFDNQRTLQRVSLEKEASRLGLDMNKFSHAIDNHIYRKDILANIAEARALRVRATPTYFIDGYKLEGMQSLSTFQQIIENKIQSRR